MNKNEKIINLIDKINADSLKTDKIEEILKLLKTIELSEMNKETIIKIFELFKFVHKESVLDSIEKNFNRIKSSVEKEILAIRLASILSDLRKIKYLDKIVYDAYSVYIYTEKVDIYIKKNIDLHKIEKEANKYSHDCFTITNSKGTKKKILGNFTAESAEKLINKWGCLNLKIKLELSAIDSKNQNY